ncbi:hypothetical protein ABL78_6675 [Leptomonas seymouri]|uniref:Transmembrane protein n=1 Tax=Leptomonas seymouri TaxID=5684 RepID=A0A0N1HV09_LEPSE|nr:hypothetical protein ABL78_6675 [Leptomonas seymouri]|eukprot:KPI84261.1 hypothetical protein ABL78_6675 [Leptomonas seymouri]
MPTAVKPTRRVRCVYTTVLNSKATRYFAVAPTKPYVSILTDALESDVRAMVSANTAHEGQCCNGSGALSTFATSSNSSCVCLTNVTLLEINHRFADDWRMLGLTFEVHYAVYEDELRRRASYTLTPAPTLSFSWMLSRSTAFPHIVSNLFHELARRDYLSSLITAPHVFAHMTIDEAEFIRHRDYRDDTGDAHSVFDSVVSSPVTGRAFEQHLGSLDSEQREVTPSSDTAEIDYCTVLRSSPSPAYSHPPAMVKIKYVSPNGTVTTYRYPEVVVHDMESYVFATPSQCDGSICAMGILCAVLMFLLILGAGVAFVVQRCRRRRSEREYEKRLLQRQLRG